MSYMFAGATSFNPNTHIAGFDTSSVTNMSYMFSGATSFNQSLSSLNTSNVTGMNYMFQNATSFNSNLSSWNVSKVTPKPPIGFATNTPAWTQAKPTW